MDETIELIDKIRIAKGITIAQLCEMSSISQSLFNKWLKGQSTPNLKSLENVCNALEIPLSFVLSSGSKFEISPDERKPYEDYSQLTNEQKELLLQVVDSIISNKNKA